LSKSINLKKILVFVNDAGSSNYICSIISNENKFFNWSIYAVADSPGSKKLENSQILYTKFFSLDEMSDIIRKQKPDIVLYSTGWLNFSSIVSDNAKKYNFKTVALVDHWTGYHERFRKNAFPDIILVMDDAAYKKANKIFNSKSTIFKIKNYYLDEIKSDYAFRKKKDHIVFLSEPEIINKDNLKIFEYTLLENILKMFDKVIVRLHPKEPKNKYYDLICKFPKANVSVVDPYDESLGSTLSKSKLSIGVQSTALYLSYLIGINTISILPKRSLMSNIPLPKKYILTNLNYIKNLNFSNKKIGELNIKAATFYESINFLSKRTN
tara:strand:- start:3 stop:977 length:975 start_codon:yes stop_codon:yes gene_type:complete